MELIDLQHHWFCRKYAATCYKQVTLDRLAGIDCPFICCLAAWSSLGTIFWCTRTTNVAFKLYIDDSRVALGSTLIICTSFYIKLQSSFMSFILHVSWSHYNIKAISFSLLEEPPRMGGMFSLILGRRRIAPMSIHAAVVLIKVGSDVLYLNVIYVNLLFLFLKLMIQATWLLRGRF